MKPYRCPTCHRPNYSEKSLAKFVVGMRERGLTQNAIALKLGIGQPYVSRILEKNAPHLRNLQKKVIDPGVEPDNVSKP